MYVHMYQAGVLAHVWRSEVDIRGVLETGPESKIQLALTNEPQDLLAPAFSGLGL